MIGQSSSHNLRRSWVLPAVICAAMGVVYLWFVHSDAVNVPFDDEWHMVTLLASVHRGQLSLNMLWAQHNENRMLFACLLLLVLELNSRFNTTVEMYVSATLLLAGVAGIWLMHRRTGSGGPWMMVPAALVLLSLAQFTVSLQGFAIAIYMVIAGFVVAVWLLEGSAKTGWLLGLAVLAAVVASYSSIQGLAIWPAGIAFLVIRGRSRREVLIWTGAGLVTSAVYLVGFDWSSVGGGGFRAAISHPVTSLRYLALLVGSVVPHSSVLHLDQASLSALGIVVLLAVAGVYLAYWRMRPAPEMGLALAMITLGLVVDIVNTVGRAGEGVGYASSGRYVVFNLWLLGGLWLSAGCIWNHLRRRRASPSFALVGVGILVALQIILSLHAGLIQGHELHGQRQVAVRLVDRYHQASPALVHADVYPSYREFRHLAMVLRELHLSVFARDG